MAPASTAAGPSGPAKVSKTVPDNVDTVDTVDTVDAVDNGAPIDGMAQLDIGDELPVDVKTTTAGSYTMTSTRGKGYSPSVDRYSPPFVRNDPQSLGDDPFQFVGRARSSIPSTPKSALIMSKNWRSSSNSSGDESDSNSDAAFPSESTVRKLNFRDLKPVPRSTSSNSYTEVDPEDAQSVYPPAFCVFVANLLQSESDACLTAAVHKTFSEYGKVYVKIRRDSIQMPFAFAQYTKLADAQAAFNKGPGRLICGRACRCEMAKAERLYLFERKHGHVATHEEAMEFLSKFGKLKTCYNATPLERTALYLNEGVLVSFKMYDDGQAAMQALRHHDVYAMNNVTGSRSPMQSHKDRVLTPAKVYLDRLEIDNRSIFLGNLPTDATEDDIKHTFSRYGTIEKITIKDSNSKFESNERVYFAFVQFKSAITADNIVESASPFFIRGQKLRVSHKVSDNKKLGYRATGSSTYKSPPDRRTEQLALEDTPSSHGSPGYTPPSQAAQGYGSPGYAPHGQAVQGYGSPGYSLPGQSAQGYGSPGYGPPGQVPQIYSPVYAPQGFGSPFGSPQGYYPNYAQYGSTFGNYNYYPCGNQGYYAPYSPSTYPYQGTPTMGVQSPVSSDASGSPNAQSYWTPASYAHSGPQYWSPPTTVSDANLPTPEHHVANSPTTDNDEEPEDRSTTPTPSRPGPVVEQSVGDQQ